MSDLVASADSLVKMLEGLDAEELKQACIATAKTRARTSDEVLRDIGSETVSRMVKAGKE